VFGSAALAGVGVAVASNLLDWDHATALVFAGALTLAITALGVPLMLLRIERPGQTRRPYDYELDTFDRHRRQLMHYAEQFAPDEEQLRRAVVTASGIRIAESRLLYDPASLNELWAVTKAAAREMEFSRETQPGGSGLLDIALRTREHDVVMSNEDDGPDLEQLGRYLAAAG
jgi:hypothetical protein